MPALTLTGGYSVSLTGVGAYTYTLPASAGTLVLTTDVSTAMAVETTRAQAAEATLTTAVSTETSRATAAEALLAPKTNASLTTPTITGLHEVAVAVAASNIDCNAATVFTKTISGNTTFTVSNVPSSGTVASFILELTNGGSATVTWWANVKWAAGAAPTLTASGVDVLGFYTTNAGTTWRGLILGQGMA